jgi:hypothetical protein
MAQFSCWDLRLSWIAVWAPECASAATLISRIRHSQDTLVLRKEKAAPLLRRPQRPASGREELSGRETLEHLSSRRIGAELTHELIAISLIEFSDALKDRFRRCDQILWRGFIDPILCRLAAADRL